jgi:hypothetical protein
MTDRCIRGQAAKETAPSGSSLAVRPDLFRPGVAQNAEVRAILRPIGRFFGVDQVVQADEVCAFSAKPAFNTPFPGILECSDMRYLTSCRFKQAMNST